MNLLYDYSTDSYGNYSDHNFEDDSICASYWMELHDHKDFTKDDCWRIIPLAIHRDDVCVVIYARRFTDVLLTKGREYIH